MKSGLFEGWISNGLALAMAIAIVPTIRKPDHSKSGCFCLDFKWFLPNVGHLSGFQMFGLPDSRSTLKAGTFATQPLFDYLKSRLVWKSDPHCFQMIPLFKY